MAQFTNYTKYKFEIEDTPSNIEVTPSFVDGTIKNERRENEIFTILAIEGSFRFYGSDFTYLNGRIDEISVWMNVYEKNSSDVYVLYAKVRLILQIEVNETGKIIVGKCDGTTNVYEDFLKYGKENETGTVDIDDVSLYYFPPTPLTIRNIVTPDRDAVPGGIDNFWRVFYQDDFFGWTSPEDYGGIIPQQGHLFDLPSGFENANTSFTSVFGLTNLLASYPESTGHALPRLTSSDNLVISHETGEQTGAAISVDIAGSAATNFSIQVAGSGSFAESVYTPNARPTETQLATRIANGYFHLCSYYVEVVSSNDSTNVPNGTTTYTHLWVHKDEYDISSSEGNAYWSLMTPIAGVQDPDTWKYYYNVLAAPLTSLFETQVGEKFATKIEAEGDGGFAFRDNIIDWTDITDDRITSMYISMGRELVKFLGSTKTDGALAFNNYTVNLVDFLEWLRQFQIKWYIDYDSVNSEYYVKLITLSDAYTRVDNGLDLTDHKGINWSANVDTVTYDDNLFSEVKRSSDGNLKNMIGVNVELPRRQRAGIEKELSLTTNYISFNIEETFPNFSEDKIYAFYPIFSISEPNDTIYIRNGHFDNQPLSNQIYSQPELDKTYQQGFGDSIIKINEDTEVTGITYYPPRKQIELEAPVYTDVTTIDQFTNIITDAGNCILKSLTRGLNGGFDTLILLIRNPIPNYDLTVDVDLPGGAAAVGYTVLVAGIEKVTDGSGQVVYSDLPEGTYFIEVDGGEDYFDGSASVNLNANKTETIELTTQTLTFTIQDSGASPIEGAEVTFEGEVKTTNASGQVVYQPVADGSYSYTVTDPRYTDVSDSVTVSGNTVETVTMADIIPMTNLVQWLRADQKELTSGKVSKLIDLSPSGNDAVALPSASNRPVYNASDADFNNEDSISPDGASQQLSYTENNLTDYTLFVVCQATIDASSVLKIFHDAENTGQNFVTIDYTTSGGTAILSEDGIGGVLRRIISEKMADETASIVMFKPDEISIDDVEGTYSNTDTPKLIEDTLLMDNGRSYKFAEKILYDANISEANEDLVITYLKNKYNIT